MEKEKASERLLIVAPELVTEMRRFFGAVVDTWDETTQLAVLVSWIQAMQIAGNRMVISSGRNSIPSPAEAIAFDSPFSFMDSIGVSRVGVDY